ncbi:MAG TPA: hypothetical protein VGL58_04385 [Caulobacteraceae bacterium]|jgi:hypothetical protein
MAFLPPSTNTAYRGSPAAAWFLVFAALLTIGPGLIHSFLPDGGAVSIAGLQLGSSRETILALFRWEGATQLALGLGMLAVALRYRPLTPLFLALLALETALDALQAWVLAPPSNGHHPPEHYGSAIIAPLALAFLVLSLRNRR